jgi:hypothetical protein
VVNEIIENCSIRSVTLSQYSFDHTDLGPNAVTLSVTDLFFNVSECTSNITVLDTIPPMAACQDTTVYLDAFGKADINVSYIDNGSTDNNGVFTSNISQTVFSCLDLNSRQVNMIITDESENRDTCFSTITVMDTIRPKAICKDFTIYLDITGNAILTTDNIDNQSFDNCNIVIKRLSKALFQRNESMTQEVTLSLEDQSGNQDSCVSIITMINLFENDIANCSDGDDNDGDGLIDCDDPDCAKPTIEGFDLDHPTAISCSQTEIDGSITINQELGNIFSLDSGITIQSSETFSNLIAGYYTVWASNSYTHCVSEETTRLINSKALLADVPAIELTGPQVLCKGLQDVDYSIDVDPNFGIITWTYTGVGIQVTKSGNSGSADLSKTATEGKLISQITNGCTTLRDSIEIELASDYLCETFSNCPKNAHISTAVIETSPNPEIYRVRDTLTTDASIVEKNYEFTAGKTLQFNPGFTLNKGIRFIADIKSCHN